MSTPKGYKSNPPRDHHIVPQHYLRGFASSSDSTRIWEYKKGDSCNSQRKPFNPWLRPIKSATVVKDFYSYTDDQGNRDVHTIENLNTQSENLLAPVLKIWREFNSTAQILNALYDGEQRANLALYVLMMQRRTPNRYRYIQQKMQEYKKLPEWSSWPDFDREAEKLAHTTMFQEVDSPVIEMIGYDWHILKAPRGLRFLTCDNPTNLVEGIQRCLTFPISPQLGLVVSHFRQNTCREATPNEMTWFNKRTVAAAQKFVFSDRTAAWICALCRE